MTEWTNYAVQLSQQLGLGFRGKPQEKIGVELGEQEMNALRDEQVVQLYELMKAAKRAEDDGEGDETTENKSR